MFYITLFYVELYRTVFSELYMQKQALRFSWSPRRLFVMRVQVGLALLGG